MELYSDMKKKGFTKYLTEKAIKELLEKQGIPDCHDSLFNEDKSVVADYFYIVRLEGENSEGVRRIEILTKDEIDSYKDTHKWITRLRTTKLDRALYKGEVGKRVQYLNTDN